MSKNFIRWAGVTVAIISLFAFATPAAAADDAAVTGTVVNETTGAPIAGARVVLLANGTPQVKTSDAQGKFAFQGLAAGTYDLRASAAQFLPYDTAPFALAASQQFDLAMFLQPASSASISSLGRVTVTGQRVLNHSSASSSVISSQAFVNSAIPQVQTALEQVPGITIEHFNNGSPGNVATLTIRGAGGFAGTNNTGYEVLVLQDGQPMRNGEFGDFDVSTLTPAIYSRVEVVKGVGGTSLFGANTIGGTVNLVTRDPLKTEGGELQLGFSGFGTSDYNFSETDTIGRFGYLLDFHQYGSDGFISPSYRADFGARKKGQFGFVTNPTLGFNVRSGLGKVRYDFSNSTYGVLSVSDESDTRDETGLLSSPSPVCFTNDISCKQDPAGNTYFFGFPGNYVWNLQPKYSFDLHTALAGGSLELRTYHQWLRRIVDGENLATPNSSFNVGCCFIQSSADRLTGLSGIWTRDFGNNTLVLGVGGNGDYYNFGTAEDFEDKFIPTSAINFNGPGNGQATEIERTILVRDDVAISPKFDLTAAGYYSDYDTLKVKRFDPRLAVVNKPNNDTVLRASIGTGFAAPRLSDLNPTLDTNSSDSGTASGCPPPPNQFCAAVQGNPNLKAETATGVDVGWQHLFGNSNIGVDLYRTNLSNHIFTGAFPAPPGLCFDPSPTPPTCPVGSTPILFIQRPINLAGSVYSGIEANASLALSQNFDFEPYYNIQTAYPTSVDRQTQVILGDVVDNQQYLGIPIHKVGWQIAYHNPARAYATIGADYYARNNSLNVPPFWVYNGSLNMPVGDSTVHIGWSNITNTNAGIFENFENGVPYPAAAGYTGSCFGKAGFVCTNAYSRAPHMLTITFDHRWGSLQ
ncbi:MAG TPA: TonB-dependent receptor [Candidatus Eremiobacteraceae bacterium]